MGLSVDTRRGSTIAEINVTPMADVMIVLLIIFMVATPIIASAPVRLPVVLHAVDHPEDTLEIVVRSTGEVTLGGTSFSSPDALGQYLESRSLLSARGLTVLIQADREATYGDVARVLGVCRRAGVVRVALGADRRLS